MGNPQFRKNIKQTQKCKCKNNIKLIYLTFLYTVHANLKNINSFSVVKSMKKFSPIKSINSSTHMKSINKTITELSIINKIPPAFVVAFVLVVAFWFY